MAEGAVRSPPGIGVREPVSDQREPDVNAGGVLSANHAVNRVTADPSDLETQVHAFWAINSPGEELELNTFLGHRESNKPDRCDEH
jgi:hypothetical protein